jgi:L-fucose isomerase-like protein
MAINPMHPHKDLTLALVALARPTFDVPLAQQVAATLLDALTRAGWTVTGSGGELIMDAAGAARAAAAICTAPADLLVLLQASFADSTMAVAVAEAAHAAGMPVLLWAVPEARDGGRLRLNSLCGINLAGHALHRRGIPYAYVLAPAGDRAGMEQVAVLARAGQARRRLRGARIGRVGEHPDGFDTCAYDAHDLQRLFGIEVVELPLAETLAAVAQVEPARRTAFMERATAYAANVPMLDAVATAGTGGVYAALQDVVERQRLAGLAVRCWPEFFTELGCAACGAMSLLNEDYYPASCEADVTGTATSLLLQSLTGSQALIADLVSLDPADNTGVLWHCGLAPVSMADPAVPIQATVHSNRKLPLLFEFPLKPGRVTLARLHHTGEAQAGARYALVVGGGEMLAAPRSFGGTSGVVRFDRPAAEVLATVLGRGLEHHLCFSYGDCRAELRAFAGLVGLPVIDL